MSPTTSPVISIFCEFAHDRSSLLRGELAREQIILKPSGVSGTCTARDSQEIPRTTLSLTLQAAADLRGLSWRGRWQRLRDKARAR